MGGFQPTIPTKIGFGDWLRLSASRPIVPTLVSRVQPRILEHTDFGSPCPSYTWSVPVPPVYAQVSTHAGNKGPRLRPINAVKRSPHGTAWTGPCTTSQYSDKVISLIIMTLVILVRFSSCRIKPQLPQIVRLPVNSFKFQRCRRTPQAEILTR